MVRVRASTGAAAPLLPTVPAFLRLQAARRGAAGGLGFRGRAISFGELAEAIDELRAPRPPRRRRGTDGRRHRGQRAGDRRDAVRALGSRRRRGADLDARDRRGGGPPAGPCTRARVLLVRTPRAPTSRARPRRSRRALAVVVERRPAVEPDVSCAAGPQRGRPGRGRPARPAGRRDRVHVGLDRRAEGRRADAREPVVGDAGVRAGARRRRRRRRRSA